MSDEIPTESALPALTDRDQWLCWRAEERDGKLTKIPVNPNSGGFGSTTKSATWSDFQTASERAQKETVDGLGFVFTDDDPIVGVDLDDCRVPETGKTREWATDIIDRPDSFTEVSPSGSGYHILVKGSLPPGRNRKGDIEIYETARFFTVTGDRVDGTRETVESRNDALEAVYREYLCEDDRDDTADDRNTAADHSDHGSPEATATSLSNQTLVERAKNASNGEKFTRLWRGQTTGYESHSEADMALCSLLAFWTGGDATRMDRLFRESGLLREIWDEPHFADGSTYGEKTIERAIAGTNDFYEPSSSDREPSTSLQEETAVDSESSGHTPTTKAASLPTFEREADYLERLEILETELQNALHETDRLQAELERERDRRHELEDELEREREQNEESERRGWLPW